MKPQPRVLMIGSGPREHSGLEALSRSPQRPRLFACPGNGGISQIAELINGSVALDDPSSLLGIAEMFDIDLTIVGPELPLIHGIADHFAAANRLLLGPTSAAARLEGSKVFAKEFMTRHGIPTAPYKVFDNVSEALAYIIGNCPCVIKADGLCGGKGVYVGETEDEARAAIHEIMVQKLFGDAGLKIVIEKKLSGVETSFFVLPNEPDNFDVLDSAGDHKRAFDGDLGPNTGGMGAFYPDPNLSEKDKERIIRKIVIPTLGGMVKEGNPFSGFLFVGIMLTAEEPMVLEFNVRLGDPEAQVIWPCLQADAYTLLRQAALGQSTPSLVWDDRVAVGVNIVSGLYPAKEKIKHKISGPIRTGEAGPNIHVYHGATIREGDDYFATGGRVLTVTALGRTFREAQAMAYDIVHQIHFEGMRFRRDIGKRAIAVAP